MRASGVGALVVAAATAATVGRGQGTEGARQAAYARVTLARTLATDPELVKAVNAKNAEAESAEAIRRKDREWSSPAGAALRKALTQGPCAQRLREAVKDDPLVAEVILMDARGASVCLSRETTDYWQGDEPKWQKTFVEGREVLVEEPAEDASSGVFAVQLSVPVVDRGRRIGALCLTLKVHREALPARPIPERGAR
jgi:hypothetical protein